MNVQLWEQSSTLIALILYKTEGPHVSNIEKGYPRSKYNKW